MVFYFYLNGLILKCRIFPWRFLQARHLTNQLALFHRLLVSCRAILVARGMYGTHLGNISDSHRFYSICSNQSALFQSYSAGRGFYPIFCLFRQGFISPPLISRNLSLNNLLGWNAQYRIWRGHQSTRSWKAKLIFWSCLWNAFFGWVLGPSSTLSRMRHLSYDANLCLVGINLPFPSLILIGLVSCGSLYIVTHLSGFGLHLTPRMTLQRIKL